MVGSVGSKSVEIGQRRQIKITCMTMNMRSRCIRFNFLAAILCAAIVGVTDCLVNNYLPTKNSIQQIHDGSSESRRLPIVVVSKQNSQQKRKIHLFMSEDDSRENEIRRKVIIIIYNIIYILF